MFVALVFSHIFPYNQRQIQVLWGVNFAQFLRPYIKKGIQNYEYKISYKSEYLESDKESQQITS